MYCAQSAIIQEIQIAVAVLIIARFNPRQQEHLALVVAKQDMYFVMLPIVV
jgi:hypothetical protein